MLGTVNRGCTVAAAEEETGQAKETDQAMDISHRYKTERVVSGSRPTADKRLEDAVALMLTESFAEDPLHKQLFGGIPKEHAQRLLFVQSRMIVRSATRKGMIHLLDGQPTAVLTGLDSRQESKRDELAQMLGMVITSLRVLGLRGFRKMLRNFSQVKSVLSFSWQSESLPGPYYRIKVVAVDQSIRGTGAFRRLISPVLDHCEARQIPVVLETHNPENVPRYEHFGFRVVKTLEAPDTDVRQYCMVREPCSSVRRA
jgi:ribosomal protein S18 acetylase RimI-like enzyme